MHFNPPYIKTMNEFLCYPVKLFCCWLLLLASSVSYGMPAVDLVLVKKNERKLYLYHKDQVIKTYRVAFGPRPRGHKREAGDERTPEGRYILDYKLENSDYHKAIHISYPNQQDRELALQSGLDPGGSIMIHGFPRETDLPAELVQHYNWTNGCIAVTNEEMDELWAAIAVNTPIEIQP